MSTPRISVVMAVFNGEEFLSDALASIAAQSFSDYEIIAVDDGSTDRSRMLLESSPRLVYIHQANQGVALARNAALEAARGEFIAFLDQDDCWVENKLKIQVEFLDAHPHVEFTLGGQRLFLEDGLAAPPWLQPSLLEGNHAGFHLGTALMRRSVLERVGPFDSQYRIGSDTDWFFRAKDSGARFEILPDVLLNKRVHASNESSQAQQSCDELLHLVRRSLKRRQPPSKSHD